MEIPEGNHTITRKIDAVYENKPQGRRYHMGASGIGEPCERKLWMQFRWCIQEEFSGRILRLFERGQNEEAQVVKWLESIGCVVTNTEEDQTFIDLGSHVGGSLDGIIESGLPGAEKTRHVLEIKTHAKKSFEDLKKKGVKESKPLHYTQMQTYMRGMGIDRALYFSVCKDNDEIYTERVKLDIEFAEKAIERAQRIATQDELPPPISTDQTWWQCRFCHLHGFCHGDEQVEKSCRTCAYSTALDDGSWYCEYHKGEIAQEYQAEGCKHYEIHDHLKK